MQKLWRVVSVTTEDEEEISVREFGCIHEVRDTILLPRGINAAYSTAPAKVRGRNMSLQHTILVKKMQMQEIKKNVMQLMRLPLSNMQ